MEAYLPDWNERGKKVAKCGLHTSTRDQFLAFLLENGYFGAFLVKNGQNDILFKIIWIFLLLETIWND